MGTTITYSSTLDYRYLMNKSKDQLAHMYLDLHRAYWKEKEKNEPPLLFGMQILLDTSLPPNQVRIVDKAGNVLAKMDFEAPSPPKQESV